MSFENPKFSTKKPYRNIRSCHEPFISGTRTNNTLPQDSQEHTKKESPKQIIILACILVTLLFLAIRPFGYRMFQMGLAQHDAFSILILLGIVGTVLVMMQRLGIIFADTNLART